MEAEGGLEKNCVGRGEGQGGPGEELWRTRWRPPGGRGLSWRGRPRTQSWCSGLHCLTSGDGQHGLRGWRVARSCGDVWGSCRGRSSLSRPRDCKCDGDRKEEEVRSVLPNRTSRVRFAQETYIFLIVMLSVCVFVHHQAGQRRVRLLVYMYIYIR